VAFPYDEVKTWRMTQYPGKFMLNVMRPYARLMDDQWQNALFAREIPELSRDTLKRMLGHISQYSDALKKRERAFYDELAAFYRTQMKGRGFAKSSLTHDAMNALMAETSSDQ
jgi:hypothetical protein